MHVTCDRPESVGRRGGSAPARPAPWHVAAQGGVHSRQRCSTCCVALGALLLLLLLLLWGRRSHAHSSLGVAEGGHDCTHTCTHHTLQHIRHMPWLGPHAVDCSPASRVMGEEGGQTLCNASTLLNCNALNAASLAGAAVALNGCAISSSCHRCRRTRSSRHDRCSNSTRRSIECGQGLHSITQRTLLPFSCAPQL